MPRRPRSFSYDEARDALYVTYRTLQRVLEMRMSSAVRSQLLTLQDMLQRIVARDNGRSQ